MQALIAVDGSPISLEAVRQAARLLSPDRDEITLYYSPPGAEVAASAANGTVARGRKVMAESVFAKALEHLPAGWRPNVRTVFGTTDPREGILQAADQCQSDLIVVGARGLSRFERLLLGSVSRAVVHSAQIPVLVVRASDHKPESTNYRVLLAFESMEHGKQLAAVLQRFSWPAGASALSIHAVENVFGGEIPHWLDDLSRAPDAEVLVQLWVKDHDAKLAAASRQITQICHELPASLTDAGHCVREGSPQDAIVRVAQADRTDLIVIGAKTSTRLGRLLVGSTAEAVLNHAPCSVLVVRKAPELAQLAPQSTPALAGEAS